MSPTPAVMAAGVVVVFAVVLTLLPRRATLTRWRRLLREAGPTAERSAAVGSWAQRSWPHWQGRHTVAMQVVAAMDRRLAVVLVAVAGAIVGLMGGGPVAGAVLAGYGAAGMSLALRVATQRAESHSRAAAVDAVAALSADLRAGLPVGAALAAAERSLTGPTVAGRDAATVARRVAAAIGVAESSGAPLADVLDRLDNHLRAADRARATAAAQAAGARASALLLAAMPVAGSGLGFLIGIDTTHALLHTPLGATCLAGAVVLQLGGLAWAGRLSRVEVPL